MKDSEVKLESNAARRSGPEILAPAGDQESLRVALSQGADAVYFGLDSGFNARARADNFSQEGLADTVALVHRAGARAYVTFNTLVFEPELKAVEGLIRAAARAGVDALIVQDPAVALLAREICPELEVHASTQMTIADAEAARFAQELGATRTVLPRELSVDEIRRFVAATTIETEVFIHGALCVSWSGQCLTSEAWGQRSANRGQCAQSCRMPYTLEVDGKERELGDVAYLLSPKDLAGVRAVPQLMEIGVEGLKIEGRQKGPAYVSTAVGAYRRWRDALLTGEGAAAGEERLRRDLRDMSLAYTRGFSDGFLAGSDHQTLVEGRFPKHRGLCLGRVAEVSGHEVLVIDDATGRPWTGGLALAERADAPQGTVSSALPGLGGASDAASGPGTPPIEPVPGQGVVFDAGDPESPDEPGGPIFSAQRTAEGWRLGFGRPGPDLDRVSVGDRVWITSDPGTRREVTRDLARGEASERLRLDVTVSGAAGRALEVIGRHGNHEVRIEGRLVATPAERRGLDAELIAEKLGAFGGTPFRLGTLDLDGLEPGLFVPVSELKSLRRELVARLLPRVEQGAGRELASPGALERVRAATEAPASTSAAIDTAPRLRVLCRNDAQLDAVIAAGLPAVELDWMENVGLARAATRAREAGLSVTVATLRVQKPGEEGFTQLLERIAPDGLLLRHWGAMMHFLDRSASDWAPRLEGDFSLNVTNSVTAGYLLKRGLAGITASHDLDESQLGALVAAIPADRLTVVIHHRIATFHTEHCVYSHLLSAGRDHRTCGRPCESHEVSLGDHLGRKHPVIVDAGCRNTVFNGEAQSTAPLVPGLLAAGVRSFRIELVRETADEVSRLIASYRELLEGRRTPQSLLEALDVRAQQGVSPTSMALIV